MNRKTQLYIVTSFATILLAYILFQNPEESQQSKSENPNAMQSGATFRTAKEAIEIESKESSLFEEKNGFLDFSGVASEEPRKDPASSEISEEERERRRKLVIEKYRELAKLFPKNRYIPREYTPAEQEEIERRDANMNYLQERILANDTLTPNESAYFYANKLEETKEKLEIIDYALKKLTEVGALNEASRKIIEERMTSIQSRSKIYSQELEKAIAKGGNPKDFDSSD